MVKNRIMKHYREDREEQRDENYYHSNDYQMWDEILTSFRQLGDALDRPGTHKLYSRTFRELRHENIFNY